MDSLILKEFLDEKAAHYESMDFIDTDPIQIPHRFSLKEDIEISGFLSSTIAWGNRKMIIKSASRMMELMDNAPFEFVINHTEKDRENLEHFVHRTFNIEDFKYFLKALQQIYKDYGGLEEQFVNEPGINRSIHEFKELFFSFGSLNRSHKHMGDPMKKSAAKRMHMYLRWMVRSSAKGVDFGIWNQISPSILYCPLDVHSGNVARKLGLLNRKQNDFKALEELQTELLKMDASDPVKYDFALFGLGVFEKF